MTLKWGKKELLKMREMREEDISFKKIGDNLGKSEDACRRKYNRVDWDSFLKDPDGTLKRNSVPQKWTRDDMVKLHSFVESERSMSFIAKKLGRSILSIESKLRETDWESFWEADGVEEIENGTDADVQEIKEKLVNALILISRHDYIRLDEINEEQFLKKINLEKKDLAIPFEEIKKEVQEELKSMGLAHPVSVACEEGTYLIVGDSHGKKTKQRMFDLLHNVIKELNVDKVIHIGHILDDDNDINYNWANFKNLTILAKKEELRIIQDKSRAIDAEFDIVREYLSLGKKLVVMNQDFISDYVKTPIRSIEQELVDDAVILNCHRQEFFSKCSDELTQSYYASPGCICEPHVIKTIRQIDFLEGKHVKVAYHDGFQKYRKMEHLMKLWKQGFLIVHVDKNQNATVVPCTINFMSKKEGFVASYFDKIITEKGCLAPDKKIFVHGDAHSPMHDPNVMDIQENICKDYGANVLVNIGDTHNFGSLNHHEMERGRPMKDDVLEESAHGYHLLKLMSEWAPEKHLLYGNHERFSKDFTDKFPQLAKLLDFQFLCSVESLDYNITSLKDVLRIGPVNFIHGDMRMYGQSGSLLEKASRTFGKYTFVGHIHQPCIRFNALSVGFSGLLNQGYNEPNASAWLHGFGLCNIYKGVAFPTTIAIEQNSCAINAKTYSPVNPEKWKMKEFVAKLTYETK